jgi:hypothetical protein
MTFTEVFGGTTIYPSGVSYRAVALSANQTLSWPVETATSGNVVAQIMDVTPSAGSLSIIMPPANEVSVGETTLFFNPGAFTFTVKDNGGNTIVAVPAGLSYQVYLIGNSTVNGTWRSTQYAAGTSSATAGSLVGAGIKAISTTLNQSMSVTTLNSNYAIGDADRSEAFVWTGGAGALTLPASGTVGNDWFCHIRNGGTGAITVTPTGSELINGSVNLTFNPGDSAIVICDGSSFFTIGFGQSVAFAFDYVSIDLSSPVTSPYTLSGANLNRIAYSFGGTLTANMQVYIPATIQQYWISNDTSGAFSLTVKVAGQTGVVIPQGSRGIYYCNGTDIIDADTASFAFPLTVAQGGTGATTESGARINLGGTSVGIGVFTAVTAADGRNALTAASSGANSDITSLTGLTTPLTVPQGGTGVATLTANGVVLGNGASALSATAVGTTGQVLVGNTGGAPSWATLTGIGVTSFSAGTTGFTPSTATTGAITLAGTLGVANGGTGTTTAFTAGSVVFAGASGVYSQDNANLFWDNTNDRLGIGTATPGAKLTVVGTAKIGEGAASNTSKLMVNTLSGTSAGIQLIQDANESWIIQNPASSTALTFSSSGTERMRITTGGNVGIGESAPTSKLVVVDNTATSGLETGISLTNTVDSNIFIRVSGSANADKKAVIGPDTSTAFVFNTAGTERMRITSGGDVGIGTSSPSYALTLGGSAANMLIAPAVTTNNALVRLTNAGGNAYVGLDNSAGGLGAVYGLHLYHAGAYPVVFSTSGAERMRITSGGDVGIGTSSPGAKLDVVGNAYVRSGVMYSDTFSAYSGGNLSINAGAGFMAFATSATERMRITATGDVGIGTSSPSYLLEVRQDGASTVNYIGSVNTTATGSAGGAGYLARAGSNFAYFYVRGDGTAYIDNATANPLGFAVNGTERMRITSTGLVGIGTATPRGDLDVSSGATGTSVTKSIHLGYSSADFYGFRVANTNAAGSFYAGTFAIQRGTGSAWDDSLIISNSGAVGIGISPTAPLHVAGTIQSSSGSTTAQMYSDGAAAYFTSVGAFPSIFLTNGTEKVRIESGGNVGIGTSSPGASIKLDVAGGIRGQAVDTTGTPAFFSTSGGGALYYNGSGVAVLRAYSDGAGAAGTLTFNASGSENMRIDSSGRLLVGSSANVGSELTLFKQSGASTAPVTRIWNNETSGNNEFIEFATETAYTTRGSITYNRAGGLVAYNTTSDYRAKDIIGSVTDAGVTIDALKVYAGKMHGATVTRPMLIAHEAQSVAPYSVTGEKDAVNEDGSPNYQQIDHSALIPLLIAELQSLRARVAQLEGN